MPPPGGDVIGRRRIDTHVHGLAALGASYEYATGHSFKADSLAGTEVFLDEPSVTATENILMASCLATGVTIIENAACEPQVQDLCDMLIAMGASIEGVGSNVLRVEGKERLHGCDYTISPDHVEVASIMALAAVTSSPITIGPAVCVRPVERAWRRLGIEYAQTDSTIMMGSDQKLLVGSDLGGAIPKIEDGPWPAFPADLTSIAVVAASQSSGEILIHEKMFESRMYFVDRLIEMGARIVLCDPHRAVVIGPADLTGIGMSSPDIRAGMALLIAAVAATGESTILTNGIAW